ncbi:polysaccharide pyruvyl transferase family protein [Pseudomonas gingeri]|uniref:Polysaccharide pyruvyl transferase family protein n=1 Tax=Pseudomonas gingeri TaxID=117681 RepID=A0A7Y7YI56_9PSED|nr:polysaccharide pyruvyl transferase family protein [Pseudomonas gingeri]NWB27981.1 polysaccharide pyruvyl transferase family protein [Pseudomonas gingeri]NWC35505.1 polysaccharide pyruvyl transferase family protein [Pseudomonas gingeri]NWD04606.1 polysaccharide pyruvyl transferase family protein [Pseudomonas gingeri]NWD51462.1 polysaccharide pyruvyl transferase family protein [Pseudomonas gingeri]NWE31028.1 polysaccharide pyruvyl transferase family protein [Pseudomonas gingeri]
MSKVWQIAIHGTFDVENYGDLLFPIIAEAELSRRLGAVQMHRFSYHAKNAAQWPYVVTSLTELPAIAHRLDATLIGGGFIIRFDKFVAENYLPPAASIHHPTGYWLTPALMAVQHGVPLIWNAPGMHCNDVPEWARPLLKRVIEQSPHVKVRDELSQATLQQLTEHGRVEVLPDTAFGLPRLLDLQTPSAELSNLRNQYGLDKPYLVVHAIGGLESFLDLWRNHSAELVDLHLLVLPIGPALGDHESALGEPLDRSVTLPFWPSPLLLAELIAHSVGVIGHSYHLAISAIAFGLPVFCSADLKNGKYTALPVYERVFQVSRDLELEPHWFAQQIGRRPLSAATRQAAEQLHEHWDRVAELVVAGQTSKPEELNRFWQALPIQLENLQALQTESLQAQRIELDQARQQLAQAPMSDLRRIYHLFKRLIARSAQ